MQRLHGAPKESEIIEKRNNPRFSSNLEEGLDGAPDKDDGFENPETES